MGEALQLPIFIIVVHLINLFCLLLLIRSGIGILFDHPKLYWTDHTKADNHWLKFGKKVMPKDKLWTSLDEADDPGILGLPGGTHNLGASRNWHYATAILWVTTGAVYIGFLFSNGSWRRLIPTDWGVFNRSIDVLHGYLTLNIPADGHTYNALQQLTYGGVVFILAPLMILTGVALSPALIGRFPGFYKIFGNRRQVARSLHFIGMILFSLFILMHVTIALGFHFYDSVTRITLGNVNANFGIALTLMLMALVLLAAFNVWITFFTIRHQASVRDFLTRIHTPVVKLLFSRLRSEQHYTKADISPFFRVNGYPPTSKVYEKLKNDDFKDWRLKVYGLVEKPMQISLEELRSLKKQEQVTKHNCIQGWTAVAEWGGLPMSDLMRMCKPKKTAKYVMFYCYDKDEEGREFYEGLRIKDMYDKQTILAYEMNGETLEIKHGAPLRLRCENKYGYKMAKYIHSIEFVDNFDHIHGGKGGYREDVIYFDWEASL